MKLLGNDFVSFLINDKKELLPSEDLLTVRATSSIGEIPFSDILSEEILDKITSVTKRYELIETSDLRYPVLSVSVIDNNDGRYFKVNPILPQMDESTKKNLKFVFEEYERDMSSARAYVNLKSELEAISKELRRYRQFRYKRLSLFAPINTVVEIPLSSVQYLIVAMIHILNEVGFKSEIAIELKREGSIVASTRSASPFINSISDIEKLFSSTVPSGELFVSISQNECVDYSISTWLNDLVIMSKMKLADRTKAPIREESQADVQRRRKIIEMFFGKP